MSLASRAVEVLARIPPAHTRAVTVRRGLEVVMPDGVTLLADRYRARQDGTQPIVLMRSPYGRSGIWALGARLFAERGYQVVIQSCRGTGGSGGEFNAYRHEVEDGLTTLGWIQRQPWFSGKIAMFGPSYLGIVQWAIASDPVPSLRAMAAPISSARVRAFTYPGGSFSLDSTLSWLAMLAQQRRRGRSALRGQLGARRRMASGFMALPLRDADVAVTGDRVPFYQDWLARMDDDAFWAPVEFDRNLQALAVPVTMVTGWYDMFLPAQLADYTALQAAGRDVRLTIGPWKHTDPGVAGESLRDSLDWFGRHLLDRAGGPRRPRVRLFVGGIRAWLDVDAWPPPARSVRWHLQSGGMLHTRAPRPSAPDRYRYDPADPTPSVGGSLLARSGGPRDNRALEQRVDVLVYTSLPLVRDVEVIGPISAELHVRSSLEHTDFFVRLCDVEPSGRSRNICDGLVRLTPAAWRRGADGVAAVEVPLWPAAHVFRRGHRVRVQVSSGAHPRFARNLGGGEPLATAVAMRPADQEIWHDPGHPSAIVLPTWDAP
ncbi:MAG TPA: CocE/NonD family hydrolase [Candidatus Saccharimonadales bacterium]|nr:CocE/NonD family hydrolase [Candidatus Saccharimonadales bacterium]